MAESKESGGKKETGRDGLGNTWKEGHFQLDSTRGRHAQTKHVVYLSAVGVHGHCPD